MTQPPPPPPGPPYPPPGTPGPYGPHGPQGVPNLYPKPGVGAGQIVGAVLAAVLGIVGVVVVLGIVAVVAVIHAISGSAGPGIQGPDDGCGGVVVYQAPDYRPRLARDQLHCH